MKTHTSSIIRQSTQLIVFKLSADLIGLTCAACCLVAVIKECGANMPPIQYLKHSPSLLLSTNPLLRRNDLYWSKAFVLATRSATQDPTVISVSDEYSAFHRGGTTPVARHDTSCLK